MCKYGHTICHTARYQLRSSKRFYLPVLRYAYAMPILGNVALFLFTLVTGRQTSVSWRESEIPYMGKEKVQEKTCRRHHRELNRCVCCLKKTVSGRRAESVARATDISL